MFALIFLSTYKVDETVYGPRRLSFSCSIVSNPYVLSMYSAVSLADGSKNDALVSQLEVTEMPYWNRNANAY